MKYINQRDAYEITLHSGSYTASQKIYELPSIDIVRCKYCKHHQDEEPGMVYCPKIVGSWVEEDWFCAYGEEKGT